MTRASEGEIVGPEEQKKLSKLAQTVQTVTEHHLFIRFRNRPMVMETEPYLHFIPLRDENFKLLAYPLLDHPTTSQVRDAYAVIAHSSPDLSANDHLILFGMADNKNYDQQAITTVWDTRKLEIDNFDKPDQCVWRSPYAKIPRGTAQPYTRLPFIMDLAGNDEGLYDDIMQSIAPIVMEQKPDGVIWWVGDGANGKSTLMDALYRIFPGQLASLTVKRLVDGRDTPTLNGQLANIVKESSEGRVDDTEIYKSIGTHEDFPVHKFNSQDSITIRGNLHHIFSANNVPAFNDKGHSARRRTFIIPFGQRFESDPTFEKRTFTPEFFGDLITEMCRYAKILERQGFRYKWSAATLAAKADYDEDANNAEKFAGYLISEGVVAFENYEPILRAYEQWCRGEASVMLGPGNVKKAFRSVGFEYKSTRLAGAEKPRNIWRLKDTSADLSPIQPTIAGPSYGQSGMFTIPGFEKIDPEDIDVSPPDFPEPKPPEEPEPAEPEPEEEPEPESTPPPRKFINNW